MKFGRDEKNSLGFKPLSSILLYLLIYAEIQSVNHKAALPCTCNASVKIRSMDKNLISVTLIMARLLVSGGLG